MRKTKRKWPKILAMALVTTLLGGMVSLVLVEKFAPDQTYIPKHLVSLPARLISAAVKPFQGAFAWAAHGVSGYLESWKLRKTIEIEYNKLKAQNDELIYQALYNAELEAKNAEYKELLGIVDQYRTQNPVVANVTGKETGNWFQMFMIDAGKNRGIQQGMAVIDKSGGLIGSVYKVQDTSAQVISIIDSRSSVAGIIQSTRDQGVIRGTLGLEDDPTCRMYYLPVDLVPRPNDVVVTSGIGQPFPKGIEIGVIRESTRYMDENKHYVVIEPKADFEHLEEVIVLVYEPSPEEVPDANDGQIQYEPVPLDTRRPEPIIGEQVEDPNLGAVTAPPRVTRAPVDGQIAPTPSGPASTLAPGATPTPDPELDRLLQEELEALEALENLAGEAGD